MRRVAKRGGIVARVEREILKNVAIIESIVTKINAKTYQKHVDNAAAAL